MAKDSKKLQKEIFSAEFKKFCRKNIQKPMVEIEKKRKLYIGAIFTIILICIILEPIIFYTSYINEVYSEKIITIMVTLPMIISAICSWISKRYKTYAKKIILPELLSYIGEFEILDKRNVEGYLTSYFHSIDLIETFNRSSFDDCFRGKYNDVDLSISETHLTYVSQTSKSRSERTVFKGLFVCFKSFKKFENKTIIKRETGFSFNGNKAVNLEDPEFEKLYQVTSTNQIEARYLITPAFMNRMVELNKKGIGKMMTISFEDRNVNIAIASEKDWFEVPLFKPSTEITNYRAILLELITVFSIIDTLKLDQNINM